MHPPDLDFECDRSLDRPLAVQVMDGINAAITDRVLRAGDRLPSVRALARTKGLSPYTVADAYQRLLALGRIESRRGSGYRVADVRYPVSNQAYSWIAPALNAQWLLSDVFADHSVPIKAGCGWIPSEWIDESDLQHAMRALGRVPGTRFGGYGHPYGMASLREQVAHNLRRNVIPVEQSNILLTQGATQALDLVVRTLLRPGDTVLVEDPCYCNLLQILQLGGLKVIGIPRTLEGHDPDFLERMIVQEKPKAMFVNTVLQNPSGTSLSVDAALGLLTVARKHGVWLIEDDIYRELTTNQTLSLATLDSLERVIYISGFSKTIAPTLRVGYIAANPVILAELARTKMAVGLTSSEVAERVVANILTEGHYDKHLAYLRDKLKDAHQRVETSMRDAGIELFHSPQAGLFLWGRLPIDPEQSLNVATSALDRGIWLAPGSYFRPGDQKSNWFRFNVGTSDNPLLWEFIRMLKP